MTVPLKAGMPPDLDLSAGYVIEFAAVHPTTGAAVAGVTIQNAALLIRNLGDSGPTDLQTGPWLLVPGQA